MLRRWHPLHVLALLAVVALVQTARPAVPPSNPVEALALPRGFEDFDKTYYPAGQLIRRDPTLLYRGRIRMDGPQGHPMLGPARFVNIPIVAWLFAPFTIVALPRAGQLWFLVNLASSLACLLLLQHRISPCSSRRRFWVTALFLSSGPLMHALNMGQTTPLMFLLLLLSERCLHRGREVPAGLWLGLASVLKAPPLLFIPYLAMRHRWRAAASGITCVLIVTTLSVACHGLTLHDEYLQKIVLPAVGADLPAHYNQSLGGALARGFSDADLLSREWIELPSGMQSIKWLVIIGLFFGTAWIVASPAKSTDRERESLELGAVLCLALLVAPFTWVHYAIWLIPVAVIAGSGLERPSSSAKRRGYTTLLVLAVLAINAPIPPLWVIERFGTFAWFRVLISHQFAGTVMMLALCLWRIRFGSGRLQTNAAEPIGTPVRPQPVR